MIRIILSSKSSPEIEFHPARQGQWPSSFVLGFLVGVFHSFTTKGSLFSFRGCVILQPKSERYNFNRQKSEGRSIVCERS